VKQRYEDLMPAIRFAAADCGYGIGVHGTGQRDLDLIAVPWITEVKTADELVEAVRAAVAGEIRVKGIWDHQPQKKPHGRLAWSIQIGGDLYIDLSVTPVSAITRS
jgi:hypothetical protein